MKGYLPTLLAAVVLAAVVGVAAAWLYPHKGGDHLGTGNNATEAISPHGSKP
jgi:hypothetical protein